MYTREYYLPHSTTCFVCGEANESGLKCRFFADERGHVHLNPVVDKRYAGFMDVVHGGIQSAMLDEAMGWCGVIQGDSEELFFTRELTVKFRKNVRPSVPIFIETRLVDVKRGMARSEGEIRDDSGAVLTLASGVFVPIPKDMMRDVRNALLFVDDGRLYHEKALRICKPKPSLRER